MRTNIDIDDELLAEATVVLGTSGKKATIEEALRRIVQGKRRRDAIERIAGTGWDDGLGTRDHKHRDAAE